MSILPLIAICGTTGVGKSKLAVDLALSLSRISSTVSHGWHGARVINADSMQVYAGLDVITNKIPRSECKGVEHLLLGFKEPGDQYVVGQWVNDALQHIDETHRRGMIPIVVGGTGYWMQHLLFPGCLVSTPSGSAQSSVRDDGSTPHHPELLKSLSALSPPLLELFNALPNVPPIASSDPDSAFELHHLLSLLDPTTGSRWHWKDTRKVLRHLEIMRETGKRVSDVLSEQEQQVNIPRFRTLVLWLHSDPVKLYLRLDSRVDVMISNGLLDEIRLLRASATQPPGSSSDQVAPENTSGPISGSDTDYTLGIYQAIGYKEFHAYLMSTTHSQVLFDKAVDEMKASTRRYAKRQVSWIRNKLLPAIHSVSSTDEEEGGRVQIYLIDASEPETWEKDVGAVAQRLINGFLNHESLPDPSSMSPAAAHMLDIPVRSVLPTSVLASRRKITCPVCTTNPERPVMIEEGSEWAGHQRSRSHRRLAGKDEKRRLEEQNREAKRAERSQRREESNTRGSLVGDVRS